jgi:hypothetical protein
MAFEAAASLMACGPLTGNQQIGRPVGKRFVIQKLYF